jgi:hypothetical protein
MSVTASWEEDTSEAEEEGIKRAVFWVAVQAARLTGRELGLTLK